MHDEHQPKVYEFQAVIHKDPDMDATYVQFPHDAREEFGRGRVRVSVTFDGVPYEGSLVNMGLHNADGSICYIVGLRKDIRRRIRKGPGEVVRVTLVERR